jgi:putative cofactor-binding repeat protein/parallel beta-helix repeat protein
MGEQRTAFTLLLILCFTVVSISQIRMAKADPVFGVIRIMPDGTVEGTDKIQRDGNVYTFTDDVNGYLNNSFGDLKGFLLVMKDNVVIDGVGHTLQCNGTGVGIYLRSMHNVTVKNFNLEGFSVGISLFVIDPVAPPEYPIERGRALNNQILNNNITVVYTESIMTGQLGGWGIYLEFANNTVVSGNTITASNPERGIFCGSGCYNTTLTDNRLIGGGLRLFRVEGSTLTGNTIDGKPVVHFDGASNQVIDGAEQVFLFNCSNMTVRNIHPSANYRIAVQLEKTRNSEVTGCEGTISLTDSSNNSVHDNHPTMVALFSGSDYNQIFGNVIANGSVILPRLTSDYSDGLMCIQLYGSDHNAVYWNELLNSNYGIRVGDIDPDESESNDIYQNNITNMSGGIKCNYGSNNTIRANIIADCGSGISLTYSDSNRILENQIENCGVSVSIYVSNSNSFYGNNFIDNSQHVSERHENFFYPGSYFYSVNNRWDNGTTGNYWSNYTGTDADGDGIGDTAYNIYENYTDNHPLMAPADIDAIPEFPKWTPLLIMLLTVTVVVVIYRRNLHKCNQGRRNR